MSFIIGCNPLPEVADCKTPIIFNNAYFCIECEKGFFLKEQNSIFKNLFSKCTNCETKYSLPQDKICKECSEILPKCIECNTSSNCLSCDAYYYLRMNNSDLFCDPCTSGGKIEGNFFSLYQY